MNNPTTPRACRIVWDPAPRVDRQLATLAESLGLIVTYSHSSRYNGHSFWSISRNGETIKDGMTIAELTAFLAGFQAASR